MRTTPRLRAYLRRFHRRAAPPPPKMPLPDNPYHRCFTRNRSFEELVRPQPDAPSPQSGR